MVEHEAQFLFRQLMEAIIYLERQYILHRSVYGFFYPFKLAKFPFFRDLKCENIFLDAFYNVKLGDFGFTRQLRPGEHSNTHCGSKPYAALELLTGQTYKGNSVDIWSAGVCWWVYLFLNNQQHLINIFSYVMLTGRFPYGGAHDDVKTIVHRQKLKSIKFPGRMTENGMFF